MHIFTKRSRNIIPLLGIILVIFLIQSCSLIRIESAQTPLSVNDLNTRLLTQEFIKEAMERTESTADSIIAGNKDLEVQKNMLQWKIKTAQRLKTLGFQTSPRLALSDVWSFMLETEDFFKSKNNKEFLGSDIYAINNSNKLNSDKIEKIAANVYNKKKFGAYRNFILDYAKNHPIENYDFEHIKIRDKYLAFLKTPDSLSVQTVGSLPEVLSDLTNRLDYGADMSAKQLQWRTQLYLREKGIDSLEIQKMFANFENQVDRLLFVAENTPETLDSAIITFRKEMDPYFYTLQLKIDKTMLTLSEERAALEKMVERERIAIDLIIKREREALSSEARIIAETGIKNGMSELRKIISSILFYVVIIICLLLGLPFYFGFMVGKSKRKDKGQA